jgi:hypothetical protein
MPNTLPKCPENDGMEFQRPRLKSRPRGSGMGVKVRAPLFRIAKAELDAQEAAGTAGLRSGCQLRQPDV